MVLSIQLTVKKIIHGRPAVDGAGVKLVRVFGYEDTKEFDPFLMLDAFDSEDPADYTKGFPWHPHRGIETITYLISGDIEHADSLGNKGSIRSGDCQWMTAGSGIIHQEMPKAADRMLGFQLWLNLPRKFKMTHPKYHGIVNGDIPVVEEETAKVHILAGVYKGSHGAMEGEFIKPLYLDVEVKPNASWSVDTDPEANVFAYILEGSGAFGEEENTLISSKQAVLFNKGDLLRVKASDQGLRFVILGGRPLGEPIAWGGPIVMNTQEELKTAFHELDQNNFIK
jgi:quercetin 2,3-dioxygenase